MHNVFQNFNQEIKSNFQGVINTLGESFNKEFSYADESTGQILVWQSFGAESNAWYHVSIMDRVDGLHGNGIQWVCVGCAIIEATTLNWEATR